MSIYNGNNLNEIAANLPANITPSHRDWYLQNCIDIYENEKLNINSGYVECMKNTNFNLIKLYNNL